MRICSTRLCATIANGTLAVSGSLNGTGGTTVTNATLAGTGSIANQVTVGNGDGATASAFIVPGAVGRIGTLTISGSLTLNSDAEFVFNLDSTSGGNGNGYSELPAASVNLDPDAQFAFSDISADPSSLTLGTEFTVIETTGGISGTFENLPDNSQFTSGPNTYQANYSSNGLIITVVPEPGTWATMLAGLGILGAAGRCRRAWQPSNP